MYVRTEITMKRILEYSVSCHYRIFEIKNHCLFELLLAIHNKIANVSTIYTIHYIFDYSSSQ